MKHLFIVCLFILLPKIFNAQTYAYKPIGFDTSCYWVEHWHMYDGGDPMDCTGERLISIEKDSIINGVQYWKAINYPTTKWSGFGTLCNSFYLNSYQFIREDTIARKIFKYTPNGETVILDFNLQVNDTFNINYYSYNPIVDSITRDVLLNGDSTTIQHGHFGISNHYKTIEGVGANFNFIWSGYGEWGTPLYTLKCFNKNGQTLYIDSSMSYDCIKKPLYDPTSIANISSKDLDIRFNNHQLSFNNTLGNIGTYCLIDMQGNCIIKKQFSESFVATQLPALPIGIYLFKINVGNLLYVEKLKIE